MNQFRMMLSTKLSRFQINPILVVLMALITAPLGFCFHPSPLFYATLTSPLHRSKDFLALSKQSKGTSVLSMSIPNAFDTATSGFASIARLPFGTNSNHPDNNGNKTFRISRLYDIEQSQACREVRERITELDFVVETVIPAASNSRALNDDTYEYYLKKDIATSSDALPVMVVVDEENEETYLVGLENIMQFLNDIYGTRGPIIDDIDETKTKAAEFLIHIGSYVPQIVRFGRGILVAGCADPEAKLEKPLILYSYESNQFCRLVREVLTELDLPYELRSAGKGSKRRAELAEITGGSTQCPYLIDPNKNIQMSESKDIIQYIYKNYALFTPPNEFLGQISMIITPVLKPIYKILAPLQAGSNRDDKSAYESEIASAKAEIKREIESDKVVIYTYTLSPFCTEAVGVLENLGIEYKEISLGAEWIPGLISEGGSQKRMALAEMTGQSSLPHIFVNSQSIGGLYEGLLPALENRSFQSLLSQS